MNMIKYFVSELDYSFCLTHLLYFRGIDLSRWRELMKEEGESANMEKFTQYVRGNHFIPNSVMVDCTADADIASCYYDWLLRGLHVVTPNKKANSGPLEQVKCLIAA